jgi:hypothetical protein
MKCEGWLSPHADKYQMIKKCCSANRCARIECPTCARRYARRVARDLLSSATGQIYAISIAAGIGSLDDFRQWRVSLWNIVSYRRNVCRWWNDIHMRSWCGRDGCIRGIIVLGSVTENEFLTTLGARWPMTLRSIRLVALYDELYAVVCPDVILADDPTHARYQPRQMTVRPHRVRATQKHPVDPMMCNPFDDPMPLLIG